jgi:hypothetical protein
MNLNKEKAGRLFLKKEGFLLLTFYQQKRHPYNRMDVFGSPCLARTDDPAVNSRMLYRLS